MRLFVGPCILHMHLYKLLCTFTVAYDQVRHFDRHCLEFLRKNVYQLGVRSFTDFPFDRRSGAYHRGLTICQRQDRVICTHVSIDTDTIERLPHRLLQAALQRRRCHWSIRDKHPQQRGMQASWACHVRVNHTSTLVNSRHTAQPVAQLELARAQLGERIGRHEGPRHLEPSLWVALQHMAPHQVLYPPEHLGQRQAHPDNARRHHQYITGGVWAIVLTSGKELLQLFDQCLCIFVATLSRHSIRTPTIHKHGPCPGMGSLRLQGPGGMHHRRGLKLV